MAILISDVAPIVRNLVLDFALTRNPGDIFTYGSSSYFTLSEPNVLAVTGVFKNGTPLTVTTQYTFDSTNLKVNVLVPLAVGDTIEIQYTYYPNYSDAEIESYIRAAVVHLSVNNYYTFQVDTTSDTFFPDPTNKEINLIAFIASILIKPDNRTVRLPDITINVPASMPTRDIIKQAVMIFKHSNGTGVFDLINTGAAFPIYPAGTW